MLAAEKEHAAQQGTAMFFIRMAFWLGVAVMLLPTDAQQQARLDTRPSTRSSVPARSAIATRAPVRWAGRRGPPSSRMRSSATPPRRHAEFQLTTAGDRGGRNPAPAEGEHERTSTCRTRSCRRNCSQHGAAPPPQRHLRLTDRPAACLDGAKAHMHKRGGARRTACVSPRLQRPWAPASPCRSKPSAPTLPCSTTGRTATAI